MSILQPGIAREFCVRQPRSAEKELVGPDRIRCEKILGAGRADDVILIDAIATDTNRADEHAVAIKSEGAGENRDSIGKLSWAVAPD